MIKMILLVLLMALSACIGYEAANSWNNTEVAAWCLVFFSIFWASLMCIAIKDTTPKS